MSRKQPDTSQLEDKQQSMKKQRNQDEYVSESESDSDSNSISSDSESESDVSSVDSVEPAQEVNEEIENEDIPSFVMSSKGESSIDYLDRWSMDRSNWKFNKNIQTYLLNHFEFEEFLNEQRFSIFCEYIKALKGNAATTTVGRCKSLLASESLPDSILKTRAANIIKILE